MSAVVLRFICFANGSAAGKSIEGQFLKSFDFNAFDGRGFGEYTHDLGEAMRFSSLANALAFYRTQSSIRPLRPDGRPNRPLTAATMEVMAVPKQRENTQMKRNVEGILIDPVTQSITPVIIDGNDYREINRVLGIDSPFTAIEIDGTNALFVDDEGLLKEPSGMRFFSLQGYQQPLAGRGIILASDRDGETISATMSVDEVKSIISWPAVKLEGFMPTSSEVKGGVNIVHTGAPIFSGPDLEYDMAAAEEALRTGARLLGERKFREAALMFEKSAALVEKITEAIRALQSPKGSA